MTNPQGPHAAVREPATAARETQPGALAYWFDIAPQVREEWLDWYQHDHMPSRVGTCYCAGRCYEAIEAERSHMVLFETVRAEDLLAPSYLGLLKVVSPQDRQRRGWYTRTIRVTCRERRREGRGIGGVLGVVRIAGAPDDGGEFARCLRDEVMPALAGMPRIGAVRLLEYDPSIRARMDQVRVTGLDDAHAQWAVLVEAGHDADLVAAMRRLQELPSWHARADADAVAIERYRLLYAMTQEPKEPSP